ncbi:MAG: AI-2E family transporter [Flavobacteriaceae bacterium]|nr:AI-2E family transporter [Flavobacteriaceae bacterium]
MREQISNNKIRQIFLLVVILLFIILIVSNLKEFIPSAFGAITLYVICRNFHLYLTEKRRWKAWISAIFLMLMTILIIVVPVYFIIDTLVEKIINSKGHVELIIKYMESVNQYIIEKTEYDVFSSLEIKKIGEYLTLYSSYFLSNTINLITTVASAYFIVYFMLINARFIENKSYILIPLKKSNIRKLGEKFQKMILANVIGIPIVALGQGATLLIGYLIFGVPSPFFLFVLTSIASIIPIVGGAIVYLPIVLTMLVNDNIVGAVGVLTFGLISGVVDNIFRFTFLKKMEDIHPLNSVFGIILGINVFGFIGLIFGPIIVSMTILLMKVYHSEFANNDVCSHRIKRKKTRLKFRSDNETTE